MELPREVPVMTLPSTILFPQAMLPLHILEPRYRRMLVDALESHRMFSVAMQKPGRQRESPSRVAGLGLIRAAVATRNGTSNLILQGIARIELAAAVSYRPYRVHQIRPLPSRAIDSVVVDALAAKVRELVGDRLKRGLKMPSSMLRKLSQLSQDPGFEPLANFPFEQILKHLAALEDAEQLADTVACTLLGVPAERQVILETLDLEQRLKRLIHFLMAEIQRQKEIPEL
jgi:Lon protease-like protein